MVAEIGTWLGVVLGLLVLVGMAAVGIMTAGSGRPNRR